ncbi:MAG: hypothetical protein ACJAUD_000859 [Crocinitomicaceae bacterium]|jgi:hypothetical protein
MKNSWMRTVSKIIFSTSILVVFLTIALSLFVGYSDFEFRDNGDAFNQFKLTWLPVCILLTLFWLGFNNSDTTMVVLRIVITIFTALVVFFHIIFSTFLMCTADYRELYKSKTEQSIKIVKRSFGCGAIDSTPDSKSFHIMKEYPLGLIRLSPADTSNIDKSRWVKIIDN